MGGRQSNGWGECVWCGEMLKPEDEERWSDCCSFCHEWNNLAQLVIKRKFFAEKQLRKCETKKALDYWNNKIQTYRDIHLMLIRALNLKRLRLWGEAY